MIPKSRAALLPQWALAGLQLLLGAAHVRAQVQVQAAETASPAVGRARPDPADPKARVPAVLYVSPLRAYQGFAEPQIATRATTR